jgi:iron-sulfur cluster assembly protein
MMQQLLSFSAHALAHIDNMLQKEPNAIGFRLSIKKTGCSGFAYVPEIITKLVNNDIHFMADNKLAVYIDPACEEFIKDIHVDYVADSVGLKQKKLVFINPREKNRCGCGESFTVD